MVKFWSRFLCLDSQQIQLNSCIQKQSTENFTVQTRWRILITVFASTASEFNWRAYISQQKFYWTRWRILIKILPLSFLGLPANSIDNWTAIYHRRKFYETRWRVLIKASCWLGPGLFWSGYFVTVWKLDFVWGWTMLIFNKLFDKAPVTANASDDVSFTCQLCPFCLEVANIANLDGCRR